MSKGDCGHLYCLKVLLDYSFAFEGKVYKRGSTFGTDNPCDASRWLAAAEAAYRSVSQDPDAPVSTSGFNGGGVAGVHAACERRKRLAVEAATAPFDNLPPITMGDPSPQPEPGPGDDAPPAEETTGSLGAPQTAPIVEVGVDNPDELPEYAKSAEGVADGEDMLNRINKMRETMSEQEIAEAFRKNTAVPPDEPHPDLSQPQNADGLKAGDPVLLASGQFDLRVVDVELASVGFPLRFTRVYRSGPRYFGPLGFNWDHEYNQSVRLLARERVAHWTGQLQEHVYEPKEDGTLEPPVGVHRRLRRVSGPGDPERWELEEALGTKWTFTLPPGAPASNVLPLVRVEDRHGNAHELIYDGEGRVARVRDAFGRSLTLLYGACGFLEGLEDHTGRRWSFLHDDPAEHLVAVRSPEVEAGILQVEYTYDQDHPDPNCRHNITRVVEDGRVVVENQYGRDLGPCYARVVYQRLGGVAIAYQYEPLQDVPPLPEYVDAPASLTSVRREGEGLRVYTFNFRGELLEERLRLQEDGTARLLVYAYRYDPAGNLRLRMEPDGLTFLLDYDHASDDPRARGNLLRTSLRPSPLTPGPTRTLCQARYEPRHQLRTEARDEAGAVTRFVYDFDLAPGGTGKLARVEHPSATLANGDVQQAVEHFTCNGTGRWTEHVTAAGHRHVRVYHPAGGPGAGLLAEEVLDADGSPMRVRREYDAAGRVVRLEDGRGNVTRFTHDALDRLVRITTPVVDGASAEYRFTFDPAGRLLREEEPRGALEDPGLAGDAIVTTHRYDDRGLRIETVRAAGSSSERRSRFSYDADGRVTAREDALGRIRRCRYDERGLLLEEIAAAGTPDERRVRHRYDRAGRCVSSAAAGREHRFEYDRYGRLAASVRADGTREERESGTNDLPVRERVVGRPSPDEAPRVLSDVTYEHDERGRPRRITFAVFADDPAAATPFVTQVLPDADGRIVRTIDPSGATRAYTYTGADLLASVVDAGGNRRAYQYDAAGNRVAASHGERRAAGGTDTFTTQRTFDARNRLREERDALGNTIRRALDARGELVGLTDALGVEVRYRRGVDGELLAVERDAGGGRVARHVFERDAAGRETAIVDPLGQRTEIRYSALDEITSVRLPDGFRIERVFRPTGELLFERHSDGRELRLTVDADGLRLTWEATGASGDVPAAPQVLEKDGLGRVVKARAGAHIVSRRFDSLGRLVAERRGDDEVSYAYDDVARTCLRTRGSGRAERLHYDLLSRIERMVLETAAPSDPALPGGLELCRYQYDGPERVAARRDGNGVVDARTYDGGARLAAQRVSPSSGPAVAELRFLRDAGGRRVVTAATPAPLDGAVARYDARSRLVSLRTGVSLPSLPTVSTQAEADAVLSTISVPPGAAGEDFTVSDADEMLERRVFDGAGTTVHELVAGTFCRLSQVDGAPVVYDARGSLRDDGTRRFEHDAFGRLVRVVRKSDAATLLELEHDALGRIVTRTVPGEGASLFYEGTTLLTESLPNGQRTERLPGIAPGETVCVTRGDQAHWMHHDENRNLLATTDATGAVVDRYAYSAFGIPAVFTPSGAPRSHPASGVEPTFGGHAYHADASVFMMGPRAYDPALGRFLEPDPAWPRDSASPYSYAGHDPMNVTDPTGLCLPRPGASGTGGTGGTGSGAGTGTGSGDSTNGKKGDGGSGSSWGANFGRGAKTIGWGLALLGFAALVLSGPFGWAGALVGTMLLASGIASVGVGSAQLATAHTRTEAQDLELNRAIDTATTISSGPGSAIGATVGVATGHDPEKSAVAGGLIEGGISLAHGLANVFEMELRFQRFAATVSNRSYRNNGPLRDLMRFALGPQANQQYRWAPYFFRRNPREYIEFSHFVTNANIERWGLQGLFNRPWNFRPVWKIEHALMDPEAFGFMLKEWKDVMAPQQLSGLTKWANRMPDWMRDTLRGGGQIGVYKGRDAGDESGD
jgi:RHS repeat-associated protein